MAEIEKFPDLTNEQMIALEGEAVQEQQEEFDIDRGTIVENEDGSVDIVEEDIDGLVDEALAGVGFLDNLAEHLNEDYMDELAGDLSGKVKEDKESRAEWENIMKDGVRLLGLKIEELSEPFEGACSAVHPMLLDAIINHQSTSIGELMPAKGPVKTVILGESNDLVQGQSRRVRNYMNYQLQFEMEEYQSELERMLFYQGFSGSAFMKTYYEPNLGRPTSIFCTAEEIIVPYQATSLKTASQYAHEFDRSENDILKYQLEGFWRDVDINAETPSDEDDPSYKDEVDRVEGRSKTAEGDGSTFYEVYVNLDLEGFEHRDADGIPTGLKLPYIVTVHPDSNTIMSIYRNWKEDDPRMLPRQYVTHYPLIPGLGFYGYGYLHLIGGLARTATTSLRALIDAGQFGNLPAGFKTHGLRVVGEDSPLRPGEFREVNAPSMDISKSLQPLPFKGADPTLYNLLEFVVSAAQNFADKTGALLSDAKSYGPVGTIMALLESGGKLHSAIHKRLHYAQMQSFRILSEVNYDWLPDQYPYQMKEQEQTVLRQDFDGRIDVVPVSDPNMPTQAHRLARSNAVFAIAAQVPQHHNMRAVLEDMYDQIGVPDPQKYLLPPPQEAQPADPVTENQGVLQNRPMKAAIEQNHAAHIKAHLAMTKMPLLQGNAQAISSLQAHVNEHISLWYRARIEAILGQPLPPPGQQLPPEVEYQLAEASATATEQMLEDETMREIMSDPNLVIALEGLNVERYKTDRDYEIDLAKLGLERNQQQIDAVDADLDRKAKLDIARMQKNRGGN